MKRAKNKRRVVQTSPEIDTHLRSSNSSQYYYLTTVSYNTQRKEMCVEFAREGETICRRYPFFPYTTLPKSTPLELLKKLLLSVGLRSFHIDEHGEKYVLRALTHEELKKIATTLSVYTASTPMIVEPTRAFLLEKGWSYFDAFACVDEELIQVDAHKKEIGFALCGEIPFEEALRVSPPDAEFLTRQAALSSLLTLPRDFVPRSTVACVEVFLENMFLKHGVLVQWKEEKSFTSSKEYAPSCVFDSVSSLDFSPVWAQLFSKSFYNIGYETINCACCAPVVLEENHVLPSSRIVVAPVDEEFYFESSSPTFARAFHAEHEGKEKRLAHKKAFFLKKYPVGPLAKGKAVAVPLIDAKQLLDDGHVTLGKDHILQWFCKKNESFLSKEIRALNARADQLTHKQTPSKTTLVHGSQEGLDKAPSAAEYFADASQKVLGEILSELPFHLLNVSSKFFSPTVAKAIVAIQEATLDSFRTFSEKKGFRIVHVGTKDVFIKGFSSLALAKSYSHELHMPQPVVKSFAKKVRIDAFA